MNRGTRLNNKVASRGRYLRLLRDECEKWNVDFDKANSSLKVSKCAYVRGQVYRELTRQGFGLSGIAHSAHVHHTTILSSLRRNEAKEIAFLEKYKDFPTPGRGVSQTKVITAPKLTHKALIDENYGRLRINRSPSASGGEDANLKG